MSPAIPQKESQGYPSSASPNPAPPYRNSLAQPLTVLLLLALLATAIYSDTFSAPFHFDDVRNITENPWIKNLSNVLDLSGSRYVGFLSFALNYQFGRLNPFGYHLVNLLIHITNGFLVYLLVRLLFRAANTPQALRLTPAPWIAIAAALLFVAHPIQTQAVTYIVQRFASLAALFYLLTVVFYLQWRLNPPDTKSRHLWYAGALIATIFAMKTKEITFTLPFMLLLIEVVFFAPLTRKLWIRLAPFLLTLSIIPLSLPGAIGEGEAGFARDTTDLSRLDYLFTQFRVILTYLRLLLFPVHQNLDYDYPVNHSLFDPPVFLSFLFLSALFALAIYLLLSSPLPPYALRLTPFASRLTAFGILWFFLTLSIESSIIPIRDVIFEHRLYLPSVGFWLAACAAALGFSDRWKIPRTIAVGLLVVLFSVLTYQRNKIWQDEFTLWSDVVQKSPQKARAYNGLGGAYAAQKKWEEAIQEYKTALTLNPNYADVHVNLGKAYKSLGRNAEAIQEYKTAITLKPDLAEAHNNLGNVYHEQGHQDEAVREYQTALTLKPDFPQAHNSMGIIYKEGERLDQALQEYKHAITLKPDYAEAHNNMGVAYKELRQYNRAIQEYKTALALQPDYADPHNNLGNLYQELGRLDEAIQEYKTTVTLKPDLAEAYNNLGNVYSILKRFKEAVQEYKAASTLDPDYADPHYNLGNVFRVLGRTDEASQEYRAAIARKPDYALAHNNLGLSYYLQGKLTEAIAELEKTTQLEPNNAEAHTNLGTLYMDQARMKEAILEFQIALKLKPDLVNAYYGLGQAYQRMGQTHEAIQAFEQALQIKPDYDKARLALKSLSR